MEADIMKTEFKAIVKDLSCVQKRDLTGQLNCKQSISTPETDHPPPHTHPHLPKVLNPRCTRPVYFLKPFCGNW